MEQERNFSKEITELIKAETNKEILSSKIKEYHYFDIASVIPDLSADERKKLYGILTEESLSDVFSYLYEQTDIIEELEPELAADILENMDSDDAKDILDNLDEKKRIELLKRVEPEAKKDLELIYSYEDNQIGSIMTTNFISVENTVSVKQAMRLLIKQAADNDNISTIYITKDNAFFGAVDLKNLICARPETDFGTLIVSSYPFIYDTDDISETIEKLKQYSEDSIPVLRHTTHEILGVITSQDIVEAVDDELGEDYARLAGLTDEEDLHEPLFQSIKKRIPWLIALLFLGLAVSTVVGAFEGVVSKLSLVICFQSLILDMAGNTGTQSLAVTIRIITDKDLSPKEKIGLVLKEMKVGFSNGFILGSVSFVFVGIYIMLLKGYSPVQSFAASGCVGISLCVAMSFSGLIGTTIPQIFKALKIDPAVASGPFITTINDLLAVCIYYSMAFFLLIKLMSMTTI